MRAALYARYSSDLQNVGSIADQLVACRAFAARMGAAVVSEHHDAAISGAATANRPGLQAMLAAARSGAVDVVIAEALDRLTRSGGDAWDIYDELKACGVEIHTLAEGRAETLHIGLKGTMNALFLEELGRKTKRGLAGVARAGRHAGGSAPYGYRKVLRYGPDGLPIPGLMEIDPDTAAVVRQVFSDYVAGVSPRAIAGRLNAAGVPGPRGGEWNASTINGNAKRGNGLLHNALYAGEMVWGRNVWVKDRKTGKRRSRAAAEADLVRTPAPELRIIDADLWARVRAQYDALSRNQRPHDARRAKRLLSGLLKCGCCGGPMAYTGPAGRIQCTRRRERGAAACANGRSPAAAGIEARVLTAIQTNLLHPAVIETAVREFHAEMKRLRASRISDRGRLERDLAETIRRAERLVDQLADGLVSGATIADKLRQLETRRADLEAELASITAGDAGADVVQLHPGTATRYRQLVEQLQAAVGEISADVDVERTNENARAALRALITGVRVIPAEGRGNYDLELEGDLAPLLAIGGGARLEMGAGGRSHRQPRLAIKIAA